METSAGRCQSPGTVPYPCQNGRETAVISGHSRAPRAVSDVGVRRLTPCLKRPSKPFHPGDGRHGVKIPAGAGGPGLGSLPPYGRGLRCRADE
jgi:hypothetical protein